VPCELPLPSRESELPLPTRASEVPLPTRESEQAGEAGEEGAAGLVDAFDRALIAVRGEEASEVEPPGPRGLIAPIGEEVRECAFLLQISASGGLTGAEPLVAARGLIAPIGEEVSEVLLEIEASGGLTAASGEEVSDVELFLQKR